MQRAKTGILLVLILVLLISLPPPVFADETENCADGNHRYSEAIVEPTATANGEITFTCTLCGYQYTQIIYATTHNWGEWIVDIQPTCTQPGERHRVCTIADISHVEVQPIAELEHDYAVAVTAPTCTAVGEKTYTCRRCGDSYKEAFGQLLAHSYLEETEKTATYGQAGKKTFTCESCGETYTETIAPLTEHTHQYVPVSTVEADCQQDGAVTMRCSVCGETITEIHPATQHSYGQWRIQKEPTLFHAGFRQRVCANNPAHVVTEELPQLVTMEVNTADMVMAPMNIGLIGLFSLALLSDLHVIFWDLHKRKKGRTVTKLKLKYWATALTAAGVIMGLPMPMLFILKGITYFNLLGITAGVIVLLTGIPLRHFSHKRRVALNGSGGVFVQGALKGEIVSRNRPS